MDRKPNALGHWLVLGAMFGIVALVFQQIATSLTDQRAASGDALSNAALFPRWVAITIAGLGLIVAGQMLMGRYPKGESAAEAEDCPPEPRSRLRLQEIAIAGLTLIYLLMLEPVGFHLTTFLVIGAMFLVLDARPVWRAVAASAALTLAASFVFEGLLKVILPVGFLGFTPPYHLLGL
ncbi:tripartite tricarboxylate transporter TctB family protein [Tropicimonas sediminicola]|uniref:Tripartite tricarboxylate transporter TctB family protein n=1 Tax=Tropicimonas sediminicola TaxID=1031541 RepID=A0A239HV71_9RHOB|nr:tripartite tricarboxylate transporter TctB family protein [Tropicimonas sediminicola]SNS85266.1 Tripartite tricarboxylate transporter TctB family protein [Tropicimonas sediminicola]